MIRIKPSTAPMKVDEEGEDQHKKNQEHGYRIGARGNQSETDLLETLKKIEEKQTTLELAYERLAKQSPKPGDSEKEIDILWRQIEIEREKVKLMRLDTFRRSY